MIVSCTGNIEILKSTVEPLRQMLKTFDVSSVEGGENMKESLETYYHVLMKYVANFLSVHKN